MSDIISLKDDKNPESSNRLKIEAGKAWNKENSNNLKFGNFDFNKKLFYHPENIVAYKEGKRPFPITLEIDLTNRCNHRCSFCYYAEHIGVDADKPSLDTEVLKTRLLEAKKLGTKALSFTGGGEPTIHKDYLQMIKFAKDAGFDVGTITNGSAITNRNVDNFIDNLQWIRISMAGGDSDSYKKVQGVDQFDLILRNIELLSKRKTERNSNFNIGIRILVTPENISTLENFANLIKHFNIDYYQIAPDQFSTDKGEFWNRKSSQDTFKRVEEILSKHGINLFTTTYISAQENLNYPTTCYAHFFMLTIVAEGYVTFCKNARGEENFYIGNIYKNSLKEIWEDEKTKQIEKWVRPNNCGLFCRHMAINNSMEDIIHPSNERTPNFVG